MNILLLASHQIAEFDDIRMFTQMGHAVFCPGGYEDPSAPQEGLRPSIPEAPVFPELIAACRRVREERGDPGDMIDWAKAALPDEVIDWADVIIAHHFVDRWIGAQWKRIRHKRVIWRTCGQSNPQLEAFMAPGRAEGLQIVRYSPKERNLPNYAGEDAVIRFGKDPAEYGPWTGDVKVAVGNVTQNMLQRGDSVGLGFWTEATRGLPICPAGPGSEKIIQWDSPPDARQGIGELSYDLMKKYLAGIRVYLYTGTQPASYTLGLIEAMLSGVPVVSIGPKAFGPGWVGEVFDLDITGRIVHDTPESARADLEWMLTDDDAARETSALMRRRAIDLFGLDTVKADWAAFLS